MRTIERHLNVFELLLERIDDAKKRGKRIEAVYMNKAEYDEFYTHAINNLTMQATQELMHHKTLFGIGIHIEEDTKEEPSKKKALKAA